MSLWVLILCLARDGECRDTPTAVMVSAAQCEAVLKLRSVGGAVCVTPNGQIIRGRKQ
jgi:hypothetical protein